MPSDSEARNAPKRFNWHLAAAMAAMLVWSTSFVATKIAYGSFPPLTLGCCRFILASLALAAVAGTGLKRFVRPARKDLPVLAAGGFLGITLYFAMENIGVDLSSASNAALLAASFPAITMLMERLFYGVTVGWRKTVGIALAMAGVLLIAGSGPGNGAGREQLAGNLLLVGAGVVWALYNFATKSVVNRYPMLTVSLYQTVAGAVAFVPLALMEKDRWRVPTAEGWTMLLYLGLLCSVAAFMFYNYGLRKLTAGTAVSLANLIPVFGVALSYLVLREELHPVQLLGGVVVIAGVYLSVRNGRAAYGPRER